MGIFRSSMRLGERVLSIGVLGALSMLVSCSGSDSDGSIVQSLVDSRVVGTGQTNCFDNDGSVITCPVAGEALFGQDAQYSSLAFDLTDNGNLTVTDNNTGLLWQQVPNDAGLSYDEAVAYVDQLELGGFSDWRLPSSKELFSISDFSMGWPYLDTNYFSLAESSVSKDEQFWTERYVGVTAEGQAEAAFGVNHGTGHIKAYPATASGPMGNYVRAVRGESYGINDFFDNGDATVTDGATGLMWEQSDSVIAMDWEDALLYAQNADTAGYEDWRLPNVKELLSIVDYSKSPTASDEANLGPAIDTDYFSITTLPDGTTTTAIDYGYFWSSTSAYFNQAVPEYFYAWYVAFGTAVDGDGVDGHGAGAVRYDTKYEGGASGEDGERYYNFVRLVRDAS